ncbi:uncharacterized protein LOC141631714 [Silene latifolia]|uniref:uncharacterized protein LOC141631714 n=1 Tax=Silene latifolia TaxID=37657 RepID=UPI003D78347C
MNIDLKKAYDSIEWVFIEQMLKHLHFPPKIIASIMQYITTPTYSIVLNGQPHGYFKGDLRSIVSIMEVFKCFSDASGLQISAEKSDIIFNGIESSLATRILAYTGFTKGSISFRYLGVKISHKRLSKLDCNIIVEKMVARKDGGIGLVDSQIWNVAAIGKLVWWIVSKKPTVD